MAYLRLYAGTGATATAQTLHELPSPTEVSPTMETIWSENTGRAQVGAEKAEMIGDVVATKRTYNVTWQFITQTQFETITTYLPKGFFWFALAGSMSGAVTGARKYYRSEIAYDIVQADTWYYTNVKVSIIEK